MKYADLVGFVDEVIIGFTDSITDQVFLMIERDKKVRRKYDKLVEKYGRGAMNRQIGKIVKLHLNLKNTHRTWRPQSNLIDSYTNHVV